MASESLNKNKGPYHGIGIAIVVLAGLPLLLYRVFYNVIEANASTPASLNKIQAQVFAGIIGTLFCAIMMVMGLLEDSFKVVVKRVGEFIYCLRYESVEHAFRWYWQNVKEKGYCFWIYLALIIFNIWFLVDGIVKFLQVTGVL